MKRRVPVKLPWENQPGWEDPMPLGVEAERTQKDGNPGDVVLKVYISEDVDFIGLRCYLGDGVQAQLYTADAPPKVYELRAPETDLILSTRPRVLESPTRRACIWRIHVLPDALIWFDVDSWHWDETESGR